MGDDMKRKCVCKICKRKGTTDVFFGAIEGGKKKYYCNEQEYINYMREKDSKDELFTYIAKDVLQYEEGQILPPILIKKINELHNFYDYEVIHECFVICKDNITYWMTTKSFTSEFGKVSYIMKIIENKINDVYDKWKFKQRQHAQQENYNLDSLINGINESKPSVSSGGILDFLDEEDV